MCIRARITIITSLYQIFMQRLCCFMSQGFFSGLVWTNIESVISLFLFWPKKQYVFAPWSLCCLCKVIMTQHLYKTIITFINCCDLNVHTKSFLHLLDCEFIDMISLLYPVTHSYLERLRSKSSARYLGLSNKAVRAQNASSSPNCISRTAAM